MIKSCDLMFPLRSLNILTGIWLTAELQGLSRETLWLHGSLSRSLKITLYMWSLCIYKWSLLHRLSLGQKLFFQHNTKFILGNKRIKLRIKCCLLFIWKMKGTSKTILRSHLFLSQIYINYRSAFPFTF